MGVAELCAEGESGGTHSHKPRSQRAAPGDLAEPGRRGKDPKSSPGGPPGPRLSQHPLAGSPHTPEGHAPP